MFVSLSVWFVYFSASPPRSPCCRLPREEEDEEVAHQFCCPPSGCSSPSSRWPHTTLPVDQCYKRFTASSVSWLEPSLLQLHADCRLILRFWILCVCSLVNCVIRSVMCVSYTCWLLRLLVLPRAVYETVRPICGVHIVLHFLIPGRAIDTASLNWFSHLKRLLCTALTSFYSCA